MHRTQISLEDAQYKALVQESRRRGMSISALIRALVDARLPAQATRATVHWIG
ncbi:MAG: ribbon-helix-helix domain-containing protein [Nitrococcus sp.]|nr:ribbon-helix-helix domain-containing protein [Nitrococcus sp.]